MIDSLSNFRRFWVRWLESKSRCRIQLSSYPSLKPNVNINFLLRTKWWIRGGVGRHPQSPTTDSCTLVVIFNLASLLKRVKFWVRERGMLAGVEESNLLRTQTGSAQSLRLAFPYSVRCPGSRRERRSKTVLINITMCKTFDLMFLLFVISFMFKNGADCFSRAGGIMISVHGFLTLFFHWRWRLVLPIFIMSFSDKIINFLPENCSNFDFAGNAIIISRWKMGTPSSFLSCWKEMKLRVVVSLGIVLKMLGHIGI